MLNKTKNGKWFIKVRGSYLPSTWQGALTYIPFVAFLIYTLVFAYDNYNRADYIILFLFPQWVAAGVVMSWIASHKA
jgi:hypothetical protein